MGWNGSDRRGNSTPIQPKVAAKKPSPIRGLIAGGLVCVLAVGVYFAFFAGSEKPKAERNDKDRGRIKEVTPAAPKAQNGEKPGEKPAAKSAAAVAQSYNEQVKEFVKKSTGTNNVTWIFPPLAPDDPDNAMRTRVAQELGSLLSIEPGEPMPPFPYSFLTEDDQKAAGADPSKIDNGNKAFLESLKKWKLAAKETDDEHRLEHKQKLLEAQNELLAGLDEGVSVNDAIRAAYEFRKNAYEMRSTIIKTLSELAANEEDHAGTIEQIHDMNKRLAEEGIKAIPIQSVIPDYEEEEENN